MPAKREWTVDQAAEIVAAHARGENATAIGLRYGAGPVTVVRALKAAGVDVRARSPWAPGARQAMATAYAEGTPTAALVTRFGVSNVSVHKTLRKLGVRVRPIDEALRRHALRHDYFAAVDTEEKAYVLGFLAADGCVCGNQIVVDLAARDRGHLEKIREALGATHPISEGEHLTRGRLSPHVRLAVNSKGMCADLARHGVVPRKSLIIEPPTLAPELMRHFWRGAFDGDGCVTMGGEKVSYVGSRAMVEGFAALARGASGTTAGVRAVGKIFEFMVEGTEKARAVLRALYDGATIYLDRKHALYLRALARPTQPEARRYDVGSQRLTVREIAARAGVKKTTAHQRLAYGWTVERILNTPVASRG